MRLTTAVAALAGFVASAFAQTNATNNNYLGVSPAQRHIIDYATAIKAVGAAVDEANNNVKLPLNIAIVDSGASLVAFAHMDSAYLGSIDISMKKARTVALFNGAMTTAQFYNASQPGGALYAIEETNGGLIIFGGGLPIIVNGVFIGAIGVSGGTVDQDVQVATAGARAVGGYIAPM